VLAIVAKDIATELRTKEMVSAMFVFALLIIFIFNFAFDLRADNIQALAPGVLWVAIAFAGMLGLSRSFILERDKGVLDSAAAAPVPVAPPDDLLAEVFAVEVVTAGGVGALEGRPDLDEEIGAGILPLDELVLDGQIVLRIQQDTVARLPVAPGPPHLLVVGLDGTGDLGVSDEPDVGLVHAHAEGVCREENEAVVGRGLNEAP